MPSQPELLIERTLDIDQVIQDFDPRTEHYSRPFSRQRTSSASKKQEQTFLAVERPISPPPLPQVRRIRPQSMLRTASKTAAPLDADEGYSTGMSDQSSIRTPRTPRNMADRNGLSREAVIMEENRVGQPSGPLSTMTDFFSSEIFHIVLHNPTTAHRFLRFCQSRACGENIEFLQRVRTLY